MGNGFQDKKGAQKMNNCFACGCSTMEETTTVFFSKLKNCMIIIKDVPCKKCIQCGEEFFTMATQKQLNELMKQAEKITSELLVVNYNNAA